MPKQQTTRCGLAVDCWLTHSSQGNQDILPWVNVLVVRAISVEVGSTIHQPGGIEHNGIPQESGNVQAVFKSFTPEIPGHKCGQDEAHQQDSGLVMPTWRDHTPSQQRGLRPTGFPSSLGWAVSFLLQLWGQCGRRDGVGNLVRM